MFIYKYLTLWKKFLQSLVGKGCGSVGEGVASGGHTLDSGLTLLLAPTPLSPSCRAPVQFGPSGEANSPPATGVRVARPLAIHRLKNEQAT